MEQYLEFAKKLAKETEEISLKYFSFEVEKMKKDAEIHAEEDKKKQE